METALEEETYSKIMMVIMGILVVIIIFIILDIMTGGSTFKTMVCSLVWYIPLSGSDLALHLGCGGIPL